MSPRFWLGALASCLAISCIPPYAPPTAAQPHAIFKLRRTYDTTPGTSLAEAVNIDDHSALRESTSSSTARAPRIDSLLAHPVASQVSVASRFHHTETRLVQESYQESRTVYRNESYDCSSGYGKDRNHRTCSRSAPHTEYDTKYRSVMKSVEVSDGECTSLVHIAPRVGGIYLLQYTYHNHGACTLSCFEQLPQPDGTFQNRPCPSPAPQSASK